jgi:CheY-like chemotaxis protein
VRQSRGGIWVTSEAGKGSTFKVYLPREEDSVEASVPAAPPPEPLRSTETALLVEDDEGVRGLARRILVAEGFDVLVAANGGEALLCAERHPSEIHLLVTDVVMPLMSGRELVARLRAARPSIRVVYMSGYADDTVVENGLLEPGIAFVGAEDAASTCGPSVSERAHQDTSGIRGVSSRALETR